MCSLFLYLSMSELGISITSPSIIFVASLKLFLYINSFKVTPYSLDILKRVSPLFATIFVSELTFKGNIDKRNIMLFI